MDKARRKAANRIFLFAGWGLLLGSLAISALYRLWPEMIGKYQLQLSSLVTLLCIMTPAVFYFCGPLGEGERDRYRVFPLRPGTLLCVPMAWGGYFFFSAVSGMILMLAEALGYSGYGATEAALLESGMGTFAMLLVIALAPAVTEEFFFRGIFQPAYASLGKWKAILLCAALFAGLHGDLLSFPALLGVGVVLGYVSWQTRSIIPSIIYHAAHNATSVILFQQARSLLGDEQVLAQLGARAGLSDLWVFLMMLLFGGAVMGSSLVFFARITNRWQREHPQTLETTPDERPVKHAYLPLWLGIAAVVIINVLGLI